MRALSNAKYSFIEKSLFQYPDTSTDMKRVIEHTLQYFKGSSAEIMMREFYFKATKRNRSLLGWHRKICMEKLFVTEPHGYVIRKEIVYHIAMVCYQEAILHISLEGVEQE